MNISKTVTTIFTICSLFGIAIAVPIITTLEENLPSIENLRDIRLQIPLKIYSAEGKLIAEFGEKRRTPTKLEQIPDDLLNAIIAIEDRRFYQHQGVDLLGLFRAAIFLLTKGTKEQGGSTITMQVARNYFLSREKTYIRKINEILLALKIEQELNKHEILELYLNKIYFGKRAYGVVAAAEVYYGTTINKLTLAQIAMIAGLPQAPSTINPINHPKAALKRRNTVLDKMLFYQFITKEQHELASNEPIETYYHSHPIEVEAPYVAEMVRQQLIEILGDEVYTQGYEVFTTIKEQHQKAANFALNQAILEYDSRHGFRPPKKIQEHIPKDITTEVHFTWAKELNNYQNIGNLTPAVVTQVTNSKAIAILGNNKYIEITWENMLWIKSSHKQAHSPTEILTSGDIIYVKRKNNNWQLSQIPIVEGAIVAMVPDNGAISALTGGFDYEHSPFNRATQAERQTGSSFKPFIYTAALANNFTTASIINDAPIVQLDPWSDNVWRPQNHTKKFYGPTRLRTGIVHSRNLVSIRILKALGIEKTLNFLENFGFNKTKLTPGLSLALGTAQFTPLEFTTRYCTFPNGGFKITPQLITKVLDPKGNAVLQPKPTIAKEQLLEDTKATLAPRVISSQLAYLMTSLLQDTINSGTGRKAKSLGRHDLAGKSGSTNDHFDSWYVGYNRDLVVTTWMGFDEPQSLNEYAVTSTLPMWMYFMQNVLNGKPDHSQQQPSGIITVRIDPKTGLLAHPSQNNSIYEVFLAGTEPTKNAQEHINKDTGKEDSLF